MSTNNLVENEIKALLCSCQHDDEAFPAELSKVVEKCFHLPGGQPVEEKAILIVENLLAPFPFREFLSAYVKDRGAFLSALIHGLYFGDYKPQTKCDFYLLFQVLAETAKLTDFQKALSKLSLDEQTRLLTHSFSHYRDGSFLIQREIVHPQLQQLKVGLQRDFYCIHKLKAMLYAYNILDEKNLSEILRNLEAHAIEESQHVYVLLEQATQAIINSSLHLYETLSTVHIPGMQPLFEPEEKESALERKKKLEELFKPYTTPPLTPAHIVHFARVFGLKGNFPFLELECELDAQSSLVEKLTWIRDLFQSSFRLINKERKLLNYYIYFIETLLEQVHGLSYQPELYLSALNQLIFAMPTKGKALDRQGSLATILDGLRSVSNDLKKVTCVVFDQSEEPLFSENAAVIDVLNQKYNSAVIHLSKTQAFEMAAKLEVRELLDTSETGHLGYAGVRNALFLLSPMLNHPVNKEEFHKRVLGSSASKIFMFDDDNVFPASNIYCHLMLFHRPNRFSALQGYNIGRYSKLIHMQTFHEFLAETTKSCIHSRWIEEPYSATMSEHFSKPKLSINVPMGAEEGHFNFLFELYPLLKASIHIPGTRFPTGQIPTRPFMGFEQRLDSYIPYAIGINLVQYLIDPLNRRGDCALPWNDSEISDHFRSLEETVKFMTLESTRKDMQERFWRNVNQLYHGDEDNVLREHLRGLIDEDIDRVVQALTDLSPEEQHSLDAIADIYRKYQNDARMLWEFGQRLLKSKNVEKERNAIENEFKIRVEDLPLTHSFYLLCKRVGEGDFIKAASKLISD
jgi:hypothetical protein